MFILLKDPFTMPGRQAKTLSSADVNDLLVFASCTRNPLRNRVVVLLSAKAGLRAGEIASLTWDMVLGPTGQISGLIELRDHAAKKCSGRLIPVHPDVAAALEAWRQVAPSSEYVMFTEHHLKDVADSEYLRMISWLRRTCESLTPPATNQHHHFMHSPRWAYHHCNREKPRFQKGNCWR
jgi:integrase